MAEEENKNVFVYYQGLPGRGQEIIQALKDLGASNSQEDGEDYKRVYYINSNGIVDSCEIEGCTCDYRWITKCYTEAFLPDPPAVPKILKDVKNTQMPVVGEIVLASDSDDTPWVPDIFIKYAQENLYPYLCVKGIHRFCIPYKGNENLLDFNPELNAVVNKK